MRNFINHIIKYVLGCFGGLILVLPLVLIGAIVFYGLDYEEKQFGILKAIDNFLLSYEWAWWLFVVAAGGGLICFINLIFFILKGGKLMDWLDKIVEKIDKIFPTKHY